MKHTLLATTALVAMTGAAAAEVTVTATARVGLRTTEGTAAVGANVDREYGQISAAGLAAWLALEATAFGGSNSADTSGGTTTITNGATLTTVDAVALDVQEIDNIIHNLEAATEAAIEAANANGTAAATTDSATGTSLSHVAADIATQLASARAIRGEIVSGESAAVAAVADMTDAVNRVRVSFGMSGETDSGIAYGASIRADNSGDRKSVV